MPKRKVHVTYWIQRWDELGWWCPKENRWGNGLDFDGKAYGDTCHRKTIKSATKMMWSLPKGSVLTKVFWKHGERNMIDYIRS